MSQIRKLKYTAELCKHLHRGTTSMRNSQKIDIEASNVRFFSANDQALFFEWLSKITCVDKYIGHLKTIHITIENDSVNEADLRELLGLFHRYSINMKPLIKLDRPEFNAWFHDHRAYWYQAVFAF